MQDWAQSSGVASPNGIRDSTNTSSSFARKGAGVRQGLTLVHIRAQLEQLQDTFMNYVGLYSGQKSSS